jgi:hypothetical protein
MIDSPTGPGNGSLNTQEILINCGAKQVKVTLYLSDAPGMNPTEIEVSEWLQHNSTSRAANFPPPVPANFSPPAAGFLTGPTGIFANSEFAKFFAEILPTCGLARLPTVQSSQYENASS